MNPYESIPSVECSKCHAEEEKLIYCDKCKYDDHCTVCGHCDGCEHVANGGLVGDQ